MREGVLKITIQKISQNFEHFKNTIIVNKNHYNSTYIINNDGRFKNIIVQVIIFLNESRKEKRYSWSKGTRNIRCWQFPRKNYCKTPLPIIRDPFNTLLLEKSSYVLCLKVKSGFHRSIPYIVLPNHVSKALFNSFMTEVSII